MSPTRLLTAAIIFCSAFWITALSAHAETLRQQLDEAVQDYQFQDFDEAGEKFRAILRRAPANVTAHYYLGAILLQQGKAAKAIPHLEKVAASPAGYRGIEALLARAYLEAGRSDKALALFETLHRNAPDNEAYTFDYARALQADGRNDDAAALYQQLIDSNGNYADPSRYQLSQIFVGTGAYASAAAHLRAIDPASPYRNAADQYLKGLEPVTRPLNVYLAGDFFYSDNPTSASAVLTGTPQPKQGSQGITFTGMVSSRNMEITPKLRAKLGYLFYGNFYQDVNARSSDFYGHFLNPSLSYHPSQAYELLIRGDLQRFSFNRQHLSNNYGATATATWRPNKRDAFSSSFNLHGGYLAKHYTDAYVAAGTVTSLKYLDGNTWSLGAGASATLRKWDSTLSVDYTLNDDHPTETASPTLGLKARDNRSREHLIRADLTIPLMGALERLSLLAGYSYSNKDYLNPQSGALYADVAGQKIGVRLQTVNARLEAELWKKFALKVAAGFEYANSASATSTLTYAVRKYYGRLSAYY